MKQLNKVVIFMEGGLIQDVVSEQPLNICVMDYDTDGAEEVHKITDWHGNTDVACVFKVNHSVANERVVKHFWKQIPKVKK